MLSVSDLAREEGISRQAAYQRIKAAGIPLQDGLVDRDVAKALMAKRIRRRMNAPRDDVQTPPALIDADCIDLDRVSYEEARRRREKAEAELAELKLAEQRGLLVRADDIKASLSRQIASLRESLLQLPPRLVPVLSADPDPARMHQVLHAEIVAALTQITEGA
jgi:hypothetical protein